MLSAPLSFGRIEKPNLHYGPAARVRSGSVQVSYRVRHDGGAALLLRFNSADKLAVLDRGQVDDPPALHMPTAV
jgi:hypothetical protein